MKTVILNREAQTEEYQKIGFVSGWTTPLIGRLESYYNPPIIQNHRRVSEDGYNETVTVTDTLIENLEFPDIALINNFKVSKQTAEKIKEIYKARNHFFSEKYIQYDYALGQYSEENDINNSTNMIRSLNDDFDTALLVTSGFSVYSSKNDIWTTAFNLTGDKSAHISPSTTLVLKFNTDSWQGLSTDTYLKNSSYVIIPDEEQITVKAVADFQQKPFEL